VRSKNPDPLFEEFAKALGAATFAQMTRAMFACDLPHVWAIILCERARTTSALNPGGAAIYPFLEQINDAADESVKKFAVKNAYQNTSEDLKADAYKVIQPATFANFERFCDINDDGSAKADSAELNAFKSHVSTFYSKLARVKDEAQKKGIGYDLRRSAPSSAKQLRFSEFYLQAYGVDLFSGVLNALLAPEDSTLHPRWKGQFETVSFLQSSAIPELFECQLTWPESQEGNNSAGDMFLFLAFKDLKPYLGRNARLHRVRLRLTHSGMGSAARYGLNPRKSAIRALGPEGFASIKWSGIPSNARWEVHAQSDDDGQAQLIGAYQTEEPIFTFERVHQNAEFALGIFWDFNDESALTFSVEEKDVGKQYADRNKWVLAKLRIRKEFKDATPDHLKDYEVCLFKQVVRFV
jgi:hypothetical protein